MDECAQMLENLSRLMFVAKGCKGHACLMPIKKVDGVWQVLELDWRLISDFTQKSINPVNLLSDKKIAMTDWELQDLAVQVVRNHSKDKLGVKIMSSNSNSSVPPAIWFIGEGGPEWLAALMKSYPNQKPVNDCDLDHVASQCSTMSKTGSVADVTFSHADHKNTRRTAPFYLCFGGPCCL